MSDPRHMIKKLLEEQFQFAQDNDIEEMKAIMFAIHFDKSDDPKNVRLIAGGDPAMLALWAHMIMRAVIADNPAAKELFIKLLEETPATDSPEQIESKVNDLLARLPTDTKPH